MRDMLLSFLKNVDANIYLRQPSTLSTTMASENKSKKKKFTKMDAALWFTGTDMSKRGTEVVDSDGRGVSYPRDRADFDSSTFNVWEYKRQKQREEEEARFIARGKAVAAAGPGTITMVTKPPPEKKVAAEHKPAKAACEWKEGVELAARLGFNPNLISKVGEALDNRAKSIFWASMSGPRGGGFSIQYRGYSSNSESEFAWSIFGKSPKVDPAKVGIAFQRPEGVAVEQWCTADMEDLDKMPFPLMEVLYLWAMHRLRPMANTFRMLNKVVRINTAFGIRLRRGEKKHIWGESKYLYITLNAAERHKAALQNAVARLRSEFGVELSEEDNQTLARLVHVFMVNTKGTCSLHEYTAVCNAVLNAVEQGVMLGGHPSENGRIAAGTALLILFEKELLHGGVLDKAFLAQIPEKWGDAADDQ